MSAEGTADGCLPQPLLQQFRLLPCSQNKCLPQTSSGQLLRFLPCSHIEPQPHPSLQRLRLLPCSQNECLSKPCNRFASCHAHRSSPHRSPACRQFSESHAHRSRPHHSPACRGLAKAHAHSCRLTDPSRAWCECAGGFSCAHLPHCNRPAPATACRPPAHRGTPCTCACRHESESTPSSNLFEFGNVTLKLTLRTQLLCL